MELSPQQLAELAGTRLGYHASDLKKYESPISRQYDPTPLPIGISIDGDYVIDNTVSSNVNADGHMLDGLGDVSQVQGKLPYHPTFSDQSPYRDASAGKWVEAYGLGPLGKDVYYPTQEQMQRPGYSAELAQYFKYEKGRGIDDIVVPPPYKNIKGTK